jgi:hypothetical protein
MEMKRGRGVRNDLMVQMLPTETRESSKCVAPDMAMSWRLFGVDDHRPSRREASKSRLFPHAEKGNGLPRPAAPMGFVCRSPQCLFAA